MDYKTVMVCLALDRANDACLAVAGDIAERFGARVVGIAASDLRPSLYFAEGQYAEKILGQEEQSIRKRLSELESEFRGVIEPRRRPNGVLLSPCHRLTSPSRPAPRIFSWSGRALRRSSIPAARRIRMTS